MAKERDNTLETLVAGGEEEEEEEGGKRPILAKAASTSTGLKVYKKRWLILCLFVLYSASNAFQWTQLVIITNILEKYYGVSTLAVSWTSIIYMVAYIPLIFPASWFLHAKVGAQHFPRFAMYSKRVLTSYYPCRQ